MNGQMACKVCGSNTYPLDDKQFDHIYHRCARCGFLYMDPKHHVTGQAERAEYDTHENSPEDEGYVKWLERFLQPSVDPFVTSGKALEFGCGPGPALAELLRRRGFEVSLFDLHFYPDRSVLNEQYDLITVTEVFEHFKEPLEEMQRLVSCLKAGGILAVMTSFPPDDKAFLNWRYRREATHIAFYTLESFRVLADQFGLDILQDNGRNMITFKRIAE